MISKLTKTLLPITALGCVQGNAMTPKKQQKPNIIYIMCDDMAMATSVAMVKSISLRLI